RSANASGTGDTTFSIISTGGSSHTGAEGREPHCEATKTVTGLVIRTKRVIMPSADPVVD
ncbi:hypothetical protein, partial [Streptomyces sp. DSM 40907]|uniref:hypothetical protein n=1 Tax=Streptomyces kutzneri TaxID=3051179 RepID=UPI0028D032DC